MTNQFKRILYQYDQEIRNGAAYREIEAEMIRNCGLRAYAAASQS